jgi:hypothetical protein
MHKIIGVLCLAVGIFLFFWGRRIADSIGSQVQQVFTGAPTDRAMYFYIGGIVLIVLGIAQFFWKRK